jgi:hypothetical protein
VIGLTDNPLLLFLFALLALWISAWLGASLLRRKRSLDSDSRQEFDLILAAALTLLGLIIGFSFSMAISRYDQRKSYEEAEANAIGTEYVRADLLPDAAAARVRRLLQDYTKARIAFYTTRDAQMLQQINRRTAQLQGELWSTVQVPAREQPDAVRALALTGMNDVLNSQGYTQAAWWNRIPVAAWVLMGLIAIVCNSMIGYGARNAKSLRYLLLVLPLIVATSFFLIADIDSPRGGIIRVKPQNLLSLLDSLPQP